MRIAICSSEVFPFAKTGGLADVCGALPLALESIGIQSVVFLPKYKSIDGKAFGLEKINNHLYKAMLGCNVQVYFIDHEEFFDRDGFYGDSNGDYPDNLKRFSYFSSKVLEVLKQLNLKVDIVHCHDWQTALVPVYLNEKYKDDVLFKDVKSILTIHNLAFQGIFDLTQRDDLNLENIEENVKKFEVYEMLNLLNAGFHYADAVTTVSPQYAKEIQSEEFGCGLEGSLKETQRDVKGILNGIDYDYWNPQTDAYLIQNYSSENYQVAKAANKAALQKMWNLSVDSQKPMFSLVGRLAHQKGVDFLILCLDEMMKLDCQVVIQGLGDKKYHDQLLALKEKYNDQMAVVLQYDEASAHLAYAGSDYFLMPSRFEPCGLSQMISMRYGAIPIVYWTGGLVDTVKAYQDDKGSANGFKFERFEKKDFMNVLKRALKIYNNKYDLNAMVQNAMKTNFSWTHSAKMYQDLYQCMLSD